MTNREMIIKSLLDDFDDSAYSESNIAYHIACPYYSGGEPHPCDGMQYPWSTLDVCGPCIREWLDKEVSE